MKPILLLLVICVSCVFGQEQDQEALQGVLTKWKAAWNDADLGKTTELYSPESKMTKRLAAEGAKAKYITNTQNIKDQLGDIVTISVGKILANGKAHVMKVTYTKMGEVPGTFSIEQDPKGAWCLKSMFITGQGEPELTQ